MTRVLIPMTLCLGLALTAIASPPMAGSGPPLIPAKSWQKFGKRDRTEFATAPDGRPRRGVKGRQVMYRVQVEEATGYPVEQFAKEIAEILYDPRGWEGTKRVWFQQRRRAQLRILLATPMTVDRLCAPLDTNGYVSCYRKNRVIINVMRWRQGAAAWKGALSDYRDYLINHEVGHALGQRHKYCTRRGGPVPVMHPQTYGFMNCQPNSWPLLSERRRLR